MADDLNTLDALTVSVRDKRIKGYSFEEISLRTGVKVEQVITTWKEYIASNAKMSPEEQAFLAEARLENLLVKVNDRLKYADRAEDFELVIKLLGEISKLQGINKENKRNAEDALAIITNAQTQLIMQAFFALLASVQVQIEQAFDKHKTIKAIKGELLGASFTNAISTEAQRVLIQEPEES